MPISVTQIKAARVLLDWTQKDLADQSGVNRDTVANIESGRNVPQQDTYQKVVGAIEAAGIEFLPGDGVRRKEAGVTTYEGRDGFALFRKDVLAEAKKGNPDICVSNVDERLFDKWGEGEVNDNYRTAMSELVKSNGDIKARFLVKKGDRNLAAKGHALYRWIADSEFGDFPFYIYGNKTAMILFEEEKLHIFIIAHPIITGYFRKQFNDKWDTAQTSG